LQFLEGAFIFKPFAFRKEQLNMTTRTMTKKKATTTRKKNTSTRSAVRTTSKCTSAKVKQSELERTKKVRNAVIREIDANLANIEAEEKNGGKTKAKSSATSSPTPTRGRVAKRGTKATTEATSANNVTRAKRAPDAAKGTKANGKASASKKRTGNPGILDLAAEILTKSKEPMSCNAIVELAISKHGWTTNGKTPHATLHAAITREISAKGRDARFTKVERGRFTTNSQRKGA
jgi:hypothetical protein